MQNLSAMLLFLNSHYVSEMSRPSHPLSKCIGTVDGILVQILSAPSFTMNLSPSIAKKSAGEVITMVVTPNAIALVVGPLYPKQDQMSLSLEKHAELLERPNDCAFPRMPSWNN